MKNSYCKRIVFRLDAGNSFGYGHLSRCLSLASEFIEIFEVFFIIKTDKSDDVNAFISGKLNINKISLVFIDREIRLDEDIELINKTLNGNRSFLILDHYSINLEYQIKLKEKKIIWLQFDSHALHEFYADFVLHASPAATNQLYKPLQKNPSTIFLLGTSYAIVNSKFRGARETTNVRKVLNRILVCFGGGDDRGATIKCLKSIESVVTNIAIDIVTSSKNKFLKEIEYYTTKRDNAQLILNSSNMEELMASADIGIIAPGTLSYEAACLGLPMLLVTIADNQIINAKGWVETGCAIGLGSIENIKRGIITNSITDLTNNPKKLELMSENGFKLVDGLGALRVKNEIIKLI